MGSSTRPFSRPPRAIAPPPNPNAIGAQASNSTYNVPTVGGYDSNNYQPFFTQQAFSPAEGMQQSFFNKYGSQGGDPSIVPYNPTNKGVSNNVMNFGKGYNIIGGNSFGY